MRVVDLRHLQLGSQQVADERSRAFVYRRLRIEKQERTANRFSVRFRLSTAQVEVRTLNTRIPSVVRLSRNAAADGTPGYLFEVAFDLSKVPEREVLDLPIELMSREPPQGIVNKATFYVDDETGLLTYRLLLPEGTRYQNFDLLRYPTGTETASEFVTPANQLTMMEGRVLAFTLLNVKPGFTYEWQWEQR
jgi:hypothetical protein